MLALLLSSAFFVGIHLYVAGTRVRDRLVSKLGEPRYLIGFSLASAVGLGAMIYAYTRSPTSVWWLPPQGARYLIPFMVFLAFQLVVIGLLSPNPTAVGAEAKLGEPGVVRGILCITRHPFLWGVALWATAHLVVNGDSKSIAFFGAFLFVALAGTRSIDEKRRRKHGALWQTFAEQSSNFPFAAIVAGRTRLGLRDIAFWKLLLALALWITVFALHRKLFGVSPLIR